MTERVLVIGAGLAGLTAANALARMGVDVTVFEARDRIGGRVHTVRSSPSNLAIELGPEWFDDHGPVHQLLNAKGVTAEEASGGYRVRLGGIWRDMGELVSGSAELSRRLDELGGPDRTVASALKECCPDDTLIEAKQRLWRYIEGFHAADPEQLSLQWLKQVEESESAADASTRVPAGLDHVVQLVRDDGGVAFDIRLASEVRRVRWSKGSVELTISSPDGDVVEHGTAAVITLPLGVLSSNSVQFDPPLGKDAAMALLATGPVVKPVLEFTEPFWLSTAPFRDALFVQDPTLPIPTWWTQRPADRPTLTGWVAGPAVGRLPKQSGADYTSIALDSVARILGMPRPDVEAQLRTAHYHDWQGDPHATGAYTWVRADGVEAHAALGAPLDTTLYFAGEATAGNGLNATMDGAILSGRRVAEEYSGHRASR